MSEPHFNHQGRRSDGPNSKRGYSCDPSSRSPSSEDRKRSHSYDKRRDTKKYRRGYQRKDDHDSLTRNDDPRNSYRGDTGAYNYREADALSGDFDSTARYNGKDHYDHHQQEDWKCLECMTWNYPEDDRCGRCGAYYPEEESFVHPPNSGHDGFSDTGGNGAEERDEFGRVVLKKQPDRKSPEWPPRFESNGSAFVLDPRSGMFYQAESDFFYDPKSRLYYGNKKGAYFRYNATADVPFEQVQKIDPTEKSNTELEAEPALVPKPKQGISIKLKTKSLGSNKAKKGKKTAPIKPVVEQQAPASRQQKQHAVDMGKWSDRQIEKRVEADGKDRTIQRTAKGEPICGLCKRKFSSVEKLLYHERVSTLHKENLAKEQTTGGMHDVSDAQSSERSSYVDRAEQRRAMYGRENPAVVLPPVSIGSQACASTAHVNPEENLGEANIGNQLLRKMGWEAGKVVGRQDRAETANTSESLVKDWEKIEALSANGGRQPSSMSRKAGLGA